MKRLTVLVPDQPGQFARITEVLAARGVNIEDFDLETNGSDGLISISVDRYDEALKALRDANLQAVTQDTLLIRIEDKPGALAAVAIRLKDAGLDLRSMHFVRRTPPTSIVSLVTSDNARAASVLGDAVIAG